MIFIFSLVNIKRNLTLIFVENNIIKWRKDGQTEHKQIFERL